MQYDEPMARGQLRKVGDYPVPEAFISTPQLARRPSYLAQNQNQGRATLSATPAINERLPVLGIILKAALQMPRDVVRDQSRTDFACRKGRDALVDRPNAGTLLIA